MSRYPRWMRTHQHAKDIAKVEAIVSRSNPQESAPKAKTQRSRNTAADARVLRMIPVCAEGVPGTAPGTDPLAELLRSDR